PLQHDQASRLNRIQAASTGGVRACIRRVAGCAPTTGFAGHAGATANLKLTFHLDHSAGADHSNSESIPALTSDFSVKNSQIWVKGNGGKTYSGTLPQKFGEASAAAVSTDGAAIAVVPRSGQPVLLVYLSDHLITVSLTLSGVNAEWAAIAFIEN